MDYTKNNNNKVIYNLVKNSLKANRRRNLASILTIALSVCVVLVLALTSLAVNQVKYDSVKNTYHVVVRNVKGVMWKGCWKRPMLVCPRGPCIIRRMT